MNACAVFNSWWWGVLIFFYYLKCSLNHVWYYILMRSTINFVQLSNAALIICWQDIYIFPFLWCFFRFYFVDSYCVVLACLGFLNKCKFWLILWYVWNSICDSTVSTVAIGTKTSFSWWIDNDSIIRNWRILYSCKPKNMQYLAICKTRQWEFLWEWSIIFLQMKIMFISINIQNFVAIKWIWTSMHFLSG